MKIIEASYILHRGRWRIKIRFDADPVMNQHIKKVDGARFSKTMQSWHMPCKKNAYLHFKSNLPAGYKLREIKNVIAGTVARPPRPVTAAPLAVKPKDHPEKPGTNDRPPGKPSAGNIEALYDFVKELELKAYSSSTIRTYQKEFAAFLSVLDKRDAATITAEELKRYMHYCVITLQLGEHSLHSRLNALKFYYEQVLKKDKFFFDIPRPKKSFQLPRVLGEYEIGKLFNALENKKHKAILFTAYSAGLRVSEAVSLQLKDIDSDRMQIFVENAKGKKDRYVMLSPVLLDILRNYLATCKPRPKVYLFEGNDPGEPMSSRTAQNIFLEAKEKAGIKKKLSFHSLRHSFATHLLEKGVDIKYIKDLLGHFSITTTTRYLHVRKENLVNIMSPLDDIFKKGKLTF